jgi:UDP-N-acetylglucosamine acyltransferase
MAVIGSAAKQGSTGECILGDANAIREHVTIDGGTDSPTRIGTDNLIMIGSQIGPSAVVGDHGIFDNLTQISAQSTIEDYVRTSAFTSIGKKATVGAYTFVAGYVEILNDAPPFAILMGSPYRVRGVNTENLRRCGFGDDDIRLLKKTFRELFNGTQTEPDLKVLAQLKAEPNLNPHIQRLVDAVQTGLDKWQRRS